MHSIFTCNFWTLLFVTIALFIVHFASERILAHCLAKQLIAVEQKDVSAPFFMTSPTWVKTVELTEL